MSKQAYRLSREAAWAMFGSRYALTAPVFGLLAIPAIVSVIILYSANDEGPLWLWWLLTGISWGVPVAVLLIFRATVLPVRERPSRPGLTLIAFVVAGLVRGLALVPVTVALGIAQPGSLVTRILGGAIFMSLVLSLSALAVAAARTYRVAADGLFATQVELEELKQSMGERIRQQRLLLLDRAMSALAPTMESLRVILASVQTREDAAKVALDLRDTVDVVIRPLSASLAREQTAIELTQVDRKPLFYWRNLTQLMPVGRFILPGTFVILLVLFTAGSLTTHIPLGEVILTLSLVALTTFVVLWLARLVLGRVPMPYFLGAIVYTIIHAAIGMTGAYLVTAGIVHVPRNLVIGYVALIIAISLAIYFYLSVELLRSDALERQIEIIGLLNLAVSSMRQQFNVNAKRIANVLHGPVQSALYASALRLQQVDRVDEVLVARILDDMDAALAKLAETDLERPDLDLFIDEIKQVWGDATSLDVIEAVPVLDELALDATATQCVVEVIREGVNNAIKHGEASEIIVEFDRPADGLVQVCVVNNGQVLAGLASGGYGSSVLDDMTHTWSIRPVNGKTVLTAQVALNVTTEE